MSVELPPEVESFIQQAIAQGAFASTEDALTGMVDFYRSHEPSIASLKAKLQIGLDEEAAGQYGLMDFDDVIRRGRERLAAESVD